MPRGTCTIGLTALICYHSPVACRCSIGSIRLSIECLDTGSERGRYPADLLSNVILLPVQTLQAAGASADSDSACCRTCQRPISVSIVE